MIYLLDLNWTLVANSNEKRSPFIRQIEGEYYDLDLLERLKGETVLLVTARPARYAAATLASLADKVGWQPAQVFFNDRGLPPPDTKERALLEFIFPKYGADPALYFGIESNPRTRAMYARHGIRSAPKAEFMKGAA